MICLLDVLRNDFGEHDEACFKVSKGHVKSCLASWNSKKELWWISLSDVLSRRMALRTHNLTSDVLINDIGEVDEAIFQAVQNTFEFIFCTLGFEKNRLLRSRLCDVLIRRMALRTHNLISEHLKIRLWWCRWSDVSWCRIAMRNHYPFHVNRKKFLDEIVGHWTWEIIICLLDFSKKRCFKVAKGHKNIFSASWASKKATWMKKLKWCVK
jgi:hypothetical protein